MRVRCRDFFNVFFKCLFCWLFSVSTAYALTQDQVYSLHKHLNQIVELPNSNVEDKLFHIIQVANSDTEKAWLIYQWVTRHFRHDLVLAARIGNPDHHSLDDLYRWGGGSCAVYANVIHRLFNKAGIEVRTVFGTVKSGPISGTHNRLPVNHVWNAVKVNGEWRTIDATWGAGVVGNHGFEKHPNDLFFLMSPEVAVLSHFDHTDQMGYQQKFGVDARLFSRISADAVYAAGVGFDPLEILQYQTRIKGGLIVRTFEQSPGAFKVRQAPLQGLLGKHLLTLKLESPVYEELVVVQGKSWRPMQKRGQIHQMSLKPQRGELLVMGRRADTQDYEALLEYQVR